MKMGWGMQSLVVGCLLLAGAAGLQTVRMIEHVITGGAPAAGGALARALC